MERTLNDQVGELVAEVQHLRVKSNNDDTTISLMRAQYDALAADVSRIRSKAATEVGIARDRADAEVTEMRIERDQALRAFKEIDTTLMSAADLIMQALRARAGEITPEVIPDRPTRDIRDDRLPIARLSL